VLQPGRLINLLVWPSPQTLYIGATAAQQGYAMRHWQDGDLQFWIVSDINPAKLTEFENLFRTRVSGTR